MNKRRQPANSTTNQADSASTTAPSPQTSQLFPIAGIGASAGGLEALEQFLRHVPEGSGMAFVIVQHLDPTHKGIMPELLQRATAMEVVQVRDRMKVNPNCVYVIPPNKDMSILHGVLHLFAPTAPRGLRLPIDFFPRSLAEDRQASSIPPGRRPIPWRLPSRTRWNRAGPRRMATTREEMQSSQKELKSSNEELQSTNEELQSTNEELTTSREEMQSLNEELQTVNAEQQVAPTNGRWFSVRIMPYRSMEDVIGGVVITFADITAAKTLETELCEENAGLKRLLESGG